MQRYGLVLYLIFNTCCHSQTTIETTTQETERNEIYIDMEIITIEIIERLGNAVYLSWGKPLREYDLDWTYGVYYGLNMEDALQAPKFTTKELYTDVRNLSFCTQYIFAVGVVKPGALTPHPARNVRTLSTLVDEQSPPKHLQVEFLPEAEPCLLIKWSASCPYIAIPLGYLLTIHEITSPRITLLRHPRSIASDLVHTFRVDYGGAYEVKVAPDVVGAPSTDIVEFKVPQFLQPFKIRITSHLEGGFVVDWREPYIPYYVGRYVYEVYVYEGRDLQSKPSIYTTERPVFQFSGNGTEYTFMVGLRSLDGEFESVLTEPIAQNLLGENETLTINY